MVGKIVFDKVKIDTAESNAGVFIGSNDANGWDANSKTQENISTVKGSDNQFNNNIFIINDKDRIDTPIVTVDDIDNIGDANRKKRAMKKKPRIKRNKKRHVD